MSGAAEDARETAAVTDDQVACTDVTTPVENYFVISPRSVAAVSVLAAIASLTTLVIVAAVDSADALSTIALGLAILAFSIQIMVFVAQERGASQQGQQAERLNAETRSLLTEIRSTANSTAAMVGEQYRRVLEAALSAGDTKDGARASEKIDRVMESVNRALEQSPTVATTAPATTAPARSTSARAPRRASIAQVPASPEYSQRKRFFDVFPDEAEGSGSAQILGRLSVEARDAIREMVQDELRSLRSNSWVGIELHDEPAEELTGQALVERFERRSREGETDHYFRFTDKGREVARLLSATGEVPRYVERALAD